MIDGEAFAIAVGERARSALSRIPARTDTFAIGSFAFNLTAPAGADESWVGRAFLQRPDSSIAPAHSLYVWEGVSTHDLPPPPPWSATAPEPLGVVESHSNDAVRCAIDIHTDSLMVSHFAHDHSYTWFPEIAALAAWAKASPFRIPLSWLCNRRSMQVVHGAAVGINGRAVLLVGNGGAGKSTTALACALAGFEYLGDDYCAVEPAAGKVHLIYRSAKLFKSTLALLPSLEPRIENRDRIALEKGVMFLSPRDVKLRPSAELRALLLPRVCEDDGSPRLFPASREETIKAVLPSTIGGLMGGTSVTPRLILQLVRSVPAYHLLLRPDMDAVIDVVAARLEAA